ncbi:hypothetical protein ACFS7Z_21620 [Pontibacter toksunensis]|uniref:Uncharacterized protein n=1 Tax=Pontibacter toksunensis TaxID=1332631 RepID=A0ABW6C121_9BACT
MFHTSNTRERDVDEVQPGLKPVLGYTRLFFCTNPVFYSVTFIV